MHGSIQLSLSVVAHAQSNQGHSQATESDLKGETKDVVHGL